MFKDLVNPRDPLASIKPFIKAGNVAIVEGMLEKIDVLKFGGDLLSFACKAGKKDIVSALIKRGANVMSPPDRIPGEDDYRGAPLTLQAAESGDLSTLNAIIKAGGSLKAGGFVAFSPKRKNLVISNAIGCAAWNGHKDLVEHLIKKMGQ